MRLITILFLFALPFYGIAQGLHEIKCGLNATTGADTYLEDINDNGIVVGYYNGTQNKGFVLNKDGRFMEVDASTLSTSITQTRVVGINDQDVIAVQGQSGTATFEMVKGYYDSWSGDYTLQTISGNGQPTLARNTKINNKNDFIGWYQGTSSRWFYVLHDSIIPSGAAWKADRFSVGPTFYNTMAGGMNDNYQLVGYYIDGTSNIPFVYDITTGLFTLINTTLNMKVYDINNANTIVGEYKQTNGIWMAFKATLDVSTGMLSGFYSFDALFESNTITSYAKGINSNGTIVGSYLHPVNGQYTGFVYFPQALDSFALHNLNFQKDVFSQIRNTGSGPDNMWPSTVYAGIDYYTMDPYVNNGIPLVDSFLVNSSSKYKGPNGVPPKSSPLWSVFAELIDTANFGTSTNLYHLNKYKTIYKYKYFYKYHQSVFERGWAGMCYGFTNAVLRKKYHNSVFSGVYGLNQALDLSDLQNTSNEAIKSIQAEFIKQLDFTHSNYIRRFLDGDGRYPYQCGIYYLKYHFTAPFNLANPRGLNVGTGHSVLPYKIKSPQKWPFDSPTQKYDTLYLYENSQPTNPNIIATFKHRFVNYFSSSNDLVNWHGNYSGNPDAYFYNIGVRHPGMMKTKIITANKKSRSQTPDTVFTITPGRINDYLITDGSAQGSVLNGVCTYTPVSNWRPVFLLDPTRTVPSYWETDTNTTLHFQTSNYPDSAMDYSVSSNHLLMGISRATLPGEQDHGSFQKNTLRYGNPDNVNKTLSCYSILHDDGLDKAMNVLVYKLAVGPNDSLLVKTNSDYTVEITKIQGGSGTYNLWVYGDNGDSILQFMHSGISIGNNTKHTIDPFYATGSGFQTVVYIDSGMNGSLEDTLFVPNVPLGSTYSNYAVAQVAIYPNPAHDQLLVNIQHPEATSVDWDLCSVQGAVLRRGQFDYRPGQEALRLSVEGIPPGLYQMRFRAQSGWTITRVVQIQ